MSNIYGYNFISRAMIITTCLILVIFTNENCYATQSPRIETATARLGIQLGHGGKVNSASFSSDGQVVLSASDDGTVRLWETTTGRELRQFNGHSDRVNTAVFSNNDQKILTASDDGTARLWEVATGRELKRFEGHNGKVFSAMFSADEQYILTASSWDKTILHNIINTSMHKDAEGYKEEEDDDDDDDEKDNEPLINNTDTDTDALGNNTVSLWKIGLDNESSQLTEQFKFKGDMIYEGASAVFSPDSKFILTASFFDGIRLWDRNGNDQNRFKNQNIKATSAVFSSNNKYVLTASYDGIARIWNFDNGVELIRLEGHDGGVNSAVFSFDEASQFVLTASNDGTVRLWDRESGKEIWSYEGHVGKVTSAAFDKSGKYVLTSGEDRTLHLLDRKSGRKKELFEGLNGGDKKVNIKIGDGSSIYDPHGKHIQEIWSREFRYAEGKAGAMSIDFSVDNLNRSSILISNNSGSIWLWDTITGRGMRKFTQNDIPVMSAYFSSKGDRVLTSNLDGARLWDRVTGIELRKLSERVMSAAFSKDGNEIITAGWDKTIQLWDAESGKEKKNFKGHEREITSVVFSHDGKEILTASRDRTARLWNVEAGKEKMNFKGHESDVSSAVFSQDGKEILTSSWDKTARLWDAKTGQEMTRIKGHESEVTSAIFSQDEKEILTASWDNTVRLWDKKNGKEIRKFVGKGGGFNSAAFFTYKNNNFIIATGIDRTTYIWDLKTSKELVRLIGLDDNTWVVTTPDGRFDTNNLKQIKGLHWIMSDDPKRSLPIEIFFRDYYKPRLLTSVLTGEKLEEIPSVAELNRVQPKVDIKDVKVEKSTGMATILIEVANDEQETKESGVFDLRLFIDGQLVAQFPEPSDTYSAASESEKHKRMREQWRKQHEIVLDPITGKKTFLFEKIRLSSKSSLNGVEFSAYAFNEDRVKSNTAYFKLEESITLPARQPRAYVISFGIGGFEHDGYLRLEYAANDAEQFSANLTKKLKNVKNPENGKPLFGNSNVIPITLISKFGTGDKENNLIVNQATKSRIKAVIDKLTGKGKNEDQLAGIDNIDKLELIQPEDSLFILFATHGDTRDREFYLIPSDIPSGLGHTKKMEYAISGHELSAWFRGIHANDFVMIIDSCRSAAAVDNIEFQPGPMGNSGLGQLAFDKGMRILAASQKTEDAFEAEKLQRGLLSYALVDDGLVEGSADFSPKDGRIHLLEWLNYAVERTPTLLHNLITKEKELSSIQHPALFDFIGEGHNPVIHSLGR